MVVRHEDRPSLNILLKTYFRLYSIEGDRYYGEDKSVITGFAKFKNLSVLVIGQQKGIV